MTVSIHITPKRFRKVFPKLPARVIEKMVAAAHDTVEFGRTAVQQTISRTNPVPSATGTYRNSWKAVKDANGGALVNSSRQAIFVELGRKPGKRPPLAPIEQWVRVKRMASKPRDVRSIAFLIQRKIGKDGVKPRRVLERTVPVMRRYYDRAVEQHLANVVPPR